MAGKTVRVHYTGKFTDENLFDSSLPRGEPIEFVLGAGKVIKGGEELNKLFAMGKRNPAGIIICK